MRTATWSRWDADIGAWAAGRAASTFEDAFPPGRLPLGAWVRLAPFRKLVVSVCRA
ncbi:MAG TPA: hypothetical protein VLW50_29295 [Streptosporangiaceae bacterium]|nr:hypothetical protein [Streptosporangiaceae bacterium]